MNNDEIKNDEIDLVMIFSKIKSLFVGFGNFIVNTFLIARKRWLLLLCFCVFGAGVGIGVFIYSTPIFSSSLILSSSTLRNDFCSDIIDNLEEIIKDNTPEQLAKTLKIDIASAKEIQKLEFDNYDEKLKNIYKDKDTIVLGRPFRIKATVYNTDVFPALQKGLVNYLESNEYSLVRKKIKTDNILLMKSKIQKQLYQLDSLKFVVTQNLVPRGNQTGFVFGQPIDPINVYKEEINLFQDDLNLSNDLILIDNIQVIQDFSPRLRPDSPRLMRNIIIFGMLAFLTGLLYAIYLETKRKKSIN